MVARAWLCVGDLVDAGDAALHDTDIDRVRSGSFLLSRDADWKAETRDALLTDSAAPVGADVPLIIE